MQKIKFPFFTRLNSIIIVQILFVLVASAFLFLFPSDQNMEYGDLIELEKKFKTISEPFQVSELLDEKGIDQNIASIIETNLTSVFNREDVLYSAIYVQRESGNIDEVYHSNNFTVKDKTNTDEPVATDHVNHELIAKKLLDKNTELVQVTPDTKSIVYYYTFEYGQQKKPAVLTLAINHHYIITSKKQVVYSFVILVLGGLLVSLLTVYFLNKKFQIPLNDLIKELENPAQADLIVLDQKEQDVELKKLSTAVVAMHQLLKDHEKNYRVENKNLEKTHKELTHSKVFLKSIIDNSVNSIIVANPKGEIKIFNDHAVKEFGLTRNQALGMNINELFTQSIQWEKLNAEKNNSMDILCIKGNGTQFPAYMTFTPLYEKSLEVSTVLYIVRDISESTEFDNMMIRLDRYYTKGEMAGDIAHEINNFLAILSGNIELMPLMLKKNDPELIDKKLKLMKSTVDRIVSFTDGLLETNDGEAKFIQVDFNHLIELVLSFLKPLNKFDYIDVSYDTSSELPLVSVDPGQFQQLFVNLVYNSAEALEEREDDKKISIEVKLEKKDDVNRIVVTVSDNGPGVPTDKIDLLFNKRFTTKANGHGIGLVTCKKILDNHSGDISYEYNNGAVFNLNFPVNQVITVEDETPPESVHSVIA